MLANFVRPVSAVEPPIIYLLGLVDSGGVGGFTGGTPKSFE